MKSKASPFVSVKNHQSFTTSFLNLLSLSLLLILASCATTSNKTFIIERDSVKLKVRQYGKKTQKNIILIHGGPGMPGYMQTIAEKLDHEKYTVYEYFLRDATNSISKGPYQIQDHIEDLQAIIKKIKNSTKDPLEINIIAHSFGSNIALSFLVSEIEEKNLINKTILLSPAPLLYKWYSEFYKNILDRTEGEKRNEILKYIKIWNNPSFKNEEEEYYVHQDWFNLILPLYFHGDNEDKAKNVSSLILSDVKNWPSTKEASISFYTQSRKSFIPKLHKIEIPLYIIYGKEDIFPVELSTNLLENEVKSVKSFGIEQSGHQMWLEDNSSTFYAKLYEYLEM